MLSHDLRTRPRRMEEEFQRMPCLSIQGRLSRPEEPRHRVAHREVGSQSSFGAGTGDLDDEENVSWTRLSSSSLFSFPSSKDIVAESLPFFSRFFPSSDWIAAKAAQAQAAPAEAPQGQERRRAHRHHRDRPIAGLPARQREAGAPPPPDMNDVAYQQFLANQQAARNFPHLFGRPQPDPVAVQPAFVFANALQHLNAPPRPFGFQPQQRGNPFAPPPRFDAPRAVPPPVGPRMADVRRALPVGPLPHLLQPPVEAAAAMRAVQRANRNLADAMERQAAVLEARLAGQRDLAERLRINQARFAPPQQAPLHQAPARLPPAQAQEPRRRAHVHGRNRLRRNGEEMANELRRAMRELGGGDGAQRRVRFDAPEGAAEGGDRRVRAEGDAGARLFPRAPAGALGALTALAEQVARL